MTERITIATRQSKLALWQANFIREQLLAAHTGITVELLKITTKGDRWLQAPLSEVGGKGLFVKELERAILDGQADIAVHSAKDLPACLPDEFELPVIAYREAVEDVLVSTLGDLASLPHGAKVGTSSLRRKVQLLVQRPDLEISPIRGNVDTRLEKLHRGDFDAIVLAAAGLNRLQIDIDGCFTLSVDTCLPAPGQAALAIECRKDSTVLPLLAPLADPVVANCVLAERGISMGLGADCSLPIAALATYDEPTSSSNLMTLRALLASENGQHILRATCTGTDPEQMAATAIADLMHQGAAAVLTELKSA